LSRELAELQREAEQPSHSQRTWFQKLNSFVYVRCILIYSLQLPGLWLSLKDAKVKADEWKVKAQKQKDELEQEGLEPTGNAILVFNEERSALNMAWDYDHRLSNSLLSRCLSPSVQRAFHVATCAILHAMHLWQAATACRATIRGVDCLPCRPLVHAPDTNTKTTS
jgi:hypothetical protein